jgi:hypothetical protein
MFSTTSYVTEFCFVGDIFARAIVGIARGCSVGIVGSEDVSVGGCVVFV